VKKWGSPTDSQDLRKLAKVKKAGSLALLSDFHAVLSRRTKLSPFTKAPPGAIIR